MIRLIVLITNFITFYDFFMRWDSLFFCSPEALPESLQTEKKWTLVRLIILVPLLRVKYTGSRFKI